MPNIKIDIDYDTFKDLVPGAHLIPYLPRKKKKEMKKKVSIAILNIVENNMLDYFEKEYNENISNQ